MIIVDTHVHVGLRQYVPVDELLGQMDRYGVGKAVLVQYRAGLEPIGNTDNAYVAECAKEYPAKLAALGIVDWTRPDGLERLECWVRNWGIQGLRLDGEASSPGGERYAIWRKAAQLGIVVSVYGKIDRLSEIAGLFPSLRIHVEHTGMPSVNGDHILALARFPNVFVKFTVSGLSGISKEPYPHRDTHPFFEKVFQSFGAKRIMWGSNYPPVMKDEGYERTLLFLSREIPWLSSDEREWVLGRTALEMWRFQG
jgi:L-fuconolactonase